jgi:DNA replication protein DnaC
MLTEPTLNKLRALRLDAFAAAWSEQTKNPEASKLSFDERLGLLVDAECLARENKRLGRLLKEAKLRLSQACIEEIDYPARRELDKAVIRQLAGCRWVHEHQNVIITGMTGTGKTFVGCALAQQACRKGFSAIYRRASRLFDELALARADGSYVRLLAKLARVDVLVIDDWGLTPPGEQERRDFFEILEDRYGNRSTIMTSQLPPKTWHAHLADQTLADAILDRILHNAHRLVLKGPSRRKNEKETETE